MSIQVSPGSLLIAPPSMTDNCFERTVHLVTHHTAGGSFALCVNKPSKFTLQDILAETDIFTTLDLPLYWGGPVDPATVWMLHDSSWTHSNTIMFNNEWGMTSSKSMLQDLADGNAPRRFRLLYGFCSWGRGQLAAELEGSPPWNASHSWLVADDPGSDWVLETPDEEMWQAATILCGEQAVSKWF